MQIEYKVELSLLKPKAMYTLGERLRLIYAVFGYKTAHCQNEYVVIRSCSWVFAVAK